MGIPKLKRIKVSSVCELETWLAANADQAQSVMLVTQVRPSSPKHVSLAQVSDALAAHDWVGGRRYTLNAALVGHVIHRRPQGAPR